VEFESKEVDYVAVMDEPVPDFEQLAATVLNNAGIDPQDRFAPLGRQREGLGRLWLRPKTTR
jgi:hypothetical protein